MFCRKEGSPKIVSFFKLYKYATGCDICCLILGVFAAFFAGAALPTSLGCVAMGVEPIMQLYLYQKKVEENWGRIVYFSLLAVFVGLCQAALTYIYMAIFTSVGEKISYRLRRAYMKAVLHMDMSWFDTLGPGEITTRITSDIDLVRDGVGERVGILFQDTGIMVMSLVCSFYFNFQLASKVCWPMIASFLCSFVANIVAQELTTDALLQFSRAGSHAEETIANIRTTHSFNAFHSLSTLYRILVNRGEYKNMLRVCIESLAIACMTCAVYIGYALILWYGYKFNKADTLEIFEAVAIILALTMGIYSVSNIPPNLLAITSARSAAAKLYEVIETAPTINPSNAGGRRLSQVKGDLCFKDASFSYPSRPEVPIFQSFNLAIPHGQTVALVGASGSGKSTAVQLLERFYDLCSGSITLDNVDIKELNIRWYRQQIGLVSQEPVLFSGTVAENVAFGLIGTSLEGASKEIQLAAITDACIQSNAHDFILALPRGYDTDVGEKGFLLSGGQKQRIAIARAIIKNPKVLLLDEATSALDTKSESVVQDALDRASVGRTTIVIAHRLSTIKDADLILVMDRGTIVESGTHAELMKSGGPYSQLVGIQDIKDAPSPHTFSVESESSGGNSNSGNGALNNEEAMTLQSADEAMSTQDPEPPLFRSLRFITYQSFPHLDILMIGVIGAGFLGLINFIMISMAYKGATSFDPKILEFDQLVWNICKAMILVSVSAGVFQLMSLIGLGLGAQKLSSCLRNQLFDTTLQQEIGWFDKDENSVGGLVSLLSSTPQSIGAFYGETLGAFIFAIVNTVASCGISLYLNYKVTLFMMLCYPLLLMTSYFSIRLLSKFSSQSQKAYSLSTQLACENTSAIRTLVSLTREDQVFESYCSALDAPLKSGFKNAYISTIVIALSSAVTPSVIAASFFFSTFVLDTYTKDLKYLPGHITYEFSLVIIVLLIMTLSIIGTSRTVTLVSGIRKARDAAKLCYKMSCRQPLIDSSANSTGKMISTGYEKYASPIQGLVEFNNVYFHYPTRPNTMCLKGINFQVRPGQYVALVGPSGCGKSTTISLIERFYDLSRGKIMIDGYNVSDLHLPSYRDHISLVGQEPALFNISIKENILLGARSYGESPTMDDVISAAKSANIHDFIMTLPQGYDTLAGGKGTQMSGGQKQRIAIARALIRNPKILLLDEATSALDADSEKVVQAALDLASKGRTTISIAHRLSTIKHADLILVMRDGQIVERGTHEQLVERKGLYFEMVQQQVLDRDVQ